MQMLADKSEEGIIPGWDGYQEMRAFSSNQIWSKLFTSYGLE